MKHTSERRKSITALARRIAAGLASGLLLAGVGQSPSIALAHPDPSTTGSYSTTGDVSGGKYTVEPGLAVTTEAAGGAAVNPDKTAVSVASSTLAVTWMVPERTRAFFTAVAAARASR